MATNASVAEFLRPLLWRQGGKRGLVWVLVFSLFLSLATSSGQAWLPQKGTTVCDYDDLFEEDTATPSHTVTLQEVRVSPFPIPNVTSAAPRATDAPAIPRVVTQTTQAVTTVATVVSPGSAIKGSSNVAVASIAACDPYGHFVPEEFPWPEHPSRLPAIGDSQGRYALGALLGNWAIIGGMTVLHAVGARIWGASKMRFPGLLTVPASILLVSTAKASLWSVAFGSRLGQISGVASFLAQMSGVGAVAYKLTKGFKSEWVTPGDARLPLSISLESPKWMDQGASGFDETRQYRILFDDFRSGRQWFPAVDLGIAVASGVLEGVNVFGSSCRPLQATALGIYGGYTLGMMLLHPYRSKWNNVFFGTVATLQTIPLAISVYQSYTGTQSDALEKISAYALMGANMLLTARSLFDLAVLAKDGYRWWGKNTVDDGSNGVPLLGIVPGSTPGGVPGQITPPGQNTPPHPISMQQVLPPPPPPPPAPHGFGQLSQLSASPAANPLPARPVQRSHSSGL